MKASRRDDRKGAGLWVDFKFESLGMMVILIQSKIAEVGQHVSNRLRVR